MSKSSTMHAPHAYLGEENIKPLTDSRRFFMWFCAAGFYFFQFVLRTSPTVIAHDLMQSLSLDSLTLGVLISCYYYGYSAMQIPSGLLLDRIGPRRPLTMACLLCFLGAGAFALSNSFIALSLGRLFMGIGSAFGFISCVKIASQAFKRSQLSMYISFTMLLGTMGATAAGKPFAFMVDVFDWRQVHFGLALFVMMLAVAIWTVIPDGNRFYASNDKPKSVSPFTSVSLILKNPQTWLFGVFGFMMYVPLAGVADLWGVPYLMETYGVERQMASAANSSIYIGLGLGGPLWSLYVTRVQSYKKAMGLGAFFTLTFLFILLYVPLPFTVCYGVLFLMGACATSQFIAFAGVTELNTPDNTGLASGVHNMLCMLSGVIMQPLLGYILKMAWDGSHVGDIPHYTKANFQLALIVLPIAVFIAVICVFFFKESYPRDA